MMLSTINVNILYFAGAKDATGVRTESIELPKNASVKELLSNLSMMHPKVRDMLNIIQISVNYKVVGKETILNDGDEVAILPPISGG
jgi:molybdopterin converting factor subunit 1